MKEQLHQSNLYSFAGKTAIAGAIAMLIGAGFWGASGTDLWQALANNRMEYYLALLHEARPLLVVNTTFWVLGVLLMATAATLMADLCDSNPGLAGMGKVFIRTAASVAIVSFVAMLAPVFYPGSVEIASIIGWIGTRLDDTATLLIIGFGPLCLSIAGKGDWVPRWLHIWGYLTGLAGLLGLIGLYTGIVPLGFVILPVGLGWMIATGVVLLKS